MKKIFILATATVVISCSSRKTELPMSVRQIKCDYPILLKADTTNNRASLLELPFAFELTNPSNTPRKIGDAVYFYNKFKHESLFGYSPIKGWTWNGIRRVVVDDKVVKIDHDYAEKRGITHGETNTLIFSPQKPIDTTSVTQDMFKEYVVEMKKLKTNRIEIGPASDFLRENKEFSKFMFEGDSIQLRIVSDQNKIDTILFLPIDLITE